MYVQFLNVNLDGDYYDPEIYELDLNNDALKIYHLEVKLLVLLEWVFIVGHLFIV